MAQPSAPAAGPQLDNRRVLAALVDLVIIAAGVLALGFVLGMVSGGDSGSFGGQMNVIAVAWALYYYFAFESGNGQTPGKKLLKLRVVRADGGATSMREIAVRTVLRVVDGIFLYLIGLIVMLVTGQKRQRLGDLAAGTMVVDAGDAPEPAAAAPAAPEAPDADAPVPVLSPAESVEAETAVEQQQDVPPHDSPVDIGAPLPGISSPEQAATPELKEFNPFSEPAQPVAETQAEPVEPVEEPHVEEPQIEEPQVEPAPEPAYEAAPKPAYEITSEPADEPQPEPVAEKPYVEPVVAEPQPEVAPEAAHEAPSYEAGTAAEQPSAEPVPGPVYEAPAEPVYEAPAEPVYEAPAEPAPEPAQPEAEEAPGEEHVSVRPMDAPVSAMDLLMAEDEDDSPPAGDPPQGA